MKYAWIYVVASALSGCQATPVNTTTPDPLASVRGPLVSSVPSSSCTVYVYRNQTNFHAFNPEKPFLYVGDRKITKLSIGQSLCLRLPPGEHELSVREPFMFMPTYTSGKVTVVVTGQKPVYVRYGREFAGVVASGSTVNAVGSTKLQVVTKYEWSTLR